MGGITGFVSLNKQQDYSQILRQMVATMLHRGPDQKGCDIMQQGDYTVALGQTRLATIDPSDNGRLPMHYGPYSIACNGLVYNYLEIRQELERLGHRFVTQSDKEVMLHAYEEWGQDCVHRFIGMFAFVIFDRKQGGLWCCRDRAGVKPFYYAFYDGVFMFASELKALKEHPAFRSEIDGNALALYFDYAYIPAPYSIFKNTHKLEPGQSLFFDIEKQTLHKSTYWNVFDYYRKPKLDISYEEARQTAKDLLISACKYRMIADVPVGAFLSGGYDSTAVAALVQSNTSERLKTFTIGFTEGNNEAPAARAIAEHLGTDHTEFICTPKEAKEIIPLLPYFYDEPFADSSAIPTTLVSRIARKRVVAALSADAGDEIFVDYKTYGPFEDNLRLLNTIPSPLKTYARGAVRTLERLIPPQYPALKHKFDGVARALNIDQFRQAADLFHLMNSLPESYASRLFQYPVTPYITGYQKEFEGFHHPLDIILAADYQMYLQNDSMTKIDRATASVGLEGREPIVDHRIVEFVAQLPLSYKYKGNKGKRLLKDIVHEYVPQPLMDRPKAGFSLPIYSWLRQDLSYLIDCYLNPKALQASGLFNIDFVNAQVNLFREGRLHYKTFIWKLLMFQMWYERWS